MAQRFVFNVLLVSYHLLSTNLYNVCVEINFLSYPLDNENKFWSDQNNVDMLYNNNIMNLVEQGIMLES